MSFIAGASFGKWRARISIIDVFSTQSMPCFVYFWLAAASISNTRSA